MSDEKLKDAVFETKIMKTNKRHEDRIDKGRDKKVIHFHSTAPTANEQLWNLDSIIQSQIAILKNRIAGGEQLSKEDHRRLDDLVAMFSKLGDLKLRVRQQSILEGKSDQEIKELAEVAFEVLNSESDEDDEI